MKLARFSSHENFEQNEFQLVYSLMRRLNALANEMALLYHFQWLFM